MSSNGNCVGNIESLTAASSKVAREFNNVIADIESFIKDTAVLTGEELVNAGAKLGEKVASFQDSLAEVGQDIADRTQRGAAQTDRYVHDQPWAVIGAGAALGLVLGYVLARRK